MASRRCNSTLELGYEELSCEVEGEIIYVDLRNPSVWFCSKVGSHDHHHHHHCHHQDDGRCPGAFHVGCGLEETTEEPTQPPPAVCEPKNVSMAPSVVTCHVSHVTCHVTEPAGHVRVLD